MRQYHASAAAIYGRAVLILGESGSGKSKLALKLMAMGCELVGDDQVYLSESNGEVIVAPHPNAEGRIEIRGVGIFSSHVINAAPLALVIDLDEEFNQRLPISHSFVYNSLKIPMYSGKGLSDLADFIYLFLTKQIVLINEAN